MKHSDTFSSEERKTKILEHLSPKTPLTGSKLGELLKVSRQVIVQDIAILRARGDDIIATPHGYIIKTKKEKEDATLKFTIASKHDKSGIRKELETIVDLGGKIIDVMVEHPIYGELSGYLMISSRRDINKFLEKLTESRAAPLSYLTGGLHFHTIETSTREEKEDILKALSEKGFLINEG